MANRFLNHIPLIKLAGIGESLEKKFHTLGIQTIQDLLLHFPMRYEDRTSCCAIGSSSIGEYTTIEGCIIKTEVIFRRKQMLVCHIQDESGIAILRFMHFNAGMKASLAIGKWVSAYGEIKNGKTYREIIHPQYKVRANREDNALITDPTQERYTPIYPTTYGLTQNVIRKLIQAALLLLKRNPPEEILPSPLANQFLSAFDSLNIIHNPPIDTDIAQLSNGNHPAIKRFIFEELLAYHLSMLTLKTDNQKQQAYAMQVNQHYIEPFLASLPFKPTNAQQRVVQDIYQDMAKSIPMMRLIQGDVGSGKTLVAALAALNAIENNQQVVLMAPTEILAEQHYNNFKQWFEPLGISVDWLSGRLTAKNKKDRYERIKAGDITMLIGTHAVFVDKVEFAKLGLVIIDEQHRFGVNQRLTLWQKGIKDQIYPHQLIMTATPIPRTLAMTVYADLDVSVIDELPPGRTPITTVVIPNSRREEIIEKVNQACLDNRQVYWVCTLVEESETLDAQAAEMLVEELREKLPHLSIALVHGKMKSDEKQSVMQNFKAGKTQLLVATTVIEVGVDVPNASLMIIENAERLGLAQLHQLRGRVGRGSAVSHCVLMYQAPLSKVAQARMKVMRESNDGFVIAQKDLEIRGSGEILGTRQMGMANFKVVDLIRDQHLISEIQRVSLPLLQNSPQMAEQLIACWLPDRQKYINA
ncbi:MULTISPECIES: ATP-dependent DNA helicase RecG [unclassified Gilliamella]|uniref:ATP-dependent DNA helicase RecG n=1 Tax=unclassified Gilliamella TaxID=2685620 RepID=UPI002269913E|nr:MULTISPECIES: ATP-dependent DNA helicase RecG [unclassified Gilliamella]MCX8641122.1 ATP-dependent DNA helicase RecG [Gilliamella sp. B3835]MCX8707119.1 ATP-dependent DNA helicase RecG [Gilliamella sp. B3783]MCX8710384.1 ATP-dependent DNA helicase RecG [Gilliamella sp. B3780]MCX8715066.1 ATP-dependent DNA helicase RecG [Gilliamella sp. B3781]MCX8716102.1 ATP-dependent DNA helicase RecG [Gilliamella sp. B3784]